MRFQPQPPWTRAHEKFVKAWGDLQQSRARVGDGVGNLADWMMPRWGVLIVRNLTPQEARAGCRQLNAWRAAIERRTTEFRPYPRQWRRNWARRRRFTAGTTSYSRGLDFENLITARALAGAVRLMPTDSRSAR